MQAFTYDGPPPVDYKCSKCGAAGCRLFRQYQTFADEIELLCRPCALVDQERSIRTADYTPGEYEIAWLVCAVPTEDGATFWGYTSIPQNGLEWWKRLAREPDETALGRPKPIPLAR
jgi:hypothetical protein